MFSPCLCGFPPGSPVSLTLQKRQESETGVALQVPAIVFKGLERSVGRKEQGVRTRSRTTSTRHSIQGLGQNQDQ